MKQIGHPLIDVAYGISACLTDKKSLDALTSQDLSESVSKMETQMKDLQNLKVLSIYWQNNSLVGINPSQIESYKKKLHLLTGTPPIFQGFCQICGKEGVFSDANRSWFPLAAGADADPCTLPGLRGKFLCADCFRAVVLLPMGCRLCKGGAYAFHLLDPELQVEAVSEATKIISATLLTKAKGNTIIKTATRLSGRLELLEIATKSRLWGASDDGILSRRAEQGATIFSFSNSGTGPSWNQLHLPASALVFLGVLYKSGQKEIFLGWAEKSKSLFYDRICDDIETRQSLAPILAAMVRARKTPTLLSEEKDVLKLYEEVAIDKRERFDTLERIAGYIKGMEDRYRDSFIKQLSNIRSKRLLLELFRDFEKNSEKTKLRHLTIAELRLLDDESRGNEVVGLLYLLCMADE